MAFRTYSPPNLFSLSQQDRTAWAGLARYLPEFETFVTAGGRYRTFDTITERDAYFTDPVYGDTALVLGNTSTTQDTVWVYSSYMTGNFGGNLLSVWLPWDTSWNNYTPTLANLTVGSGTSNGRYRRQGTNCWFEYEFVFGAGSAVGTNPQFSLPFQGILNFNTTMVGGSHTFGDAFLIDNDGSDAFGSLVTTSTTVTDLIVQYLRADLTFLSGATVSSLAPFTWATSDRIDVRRAVYEMDIANITPFTV